MCGRKEVCREDEERDGKVASSPIGGCESELPFVVVLESVVACGAARLLSQILDSAILHAHQEYMAKFAAPCLCV